MSPEYGVAPGEAESTQEAEPTQEAESTEPDMTRGVLPEVITPWMLCWDRLGARLRSELAIHTDIQRDRSAQPAARDAAGWHARGLRIALEAYTGASSLLLPYAYDQLAKVLSAELRAGPYNAAVLGGVDAGLGYTVALQKEAAAAAAAISALSASVSALSAARAAAEAEHREWYEANGPRAGAAGSRRTQHRPGPSP